MKIEDTKWYNFLECLPALGLEIIIINIFKEENTHELQMRVFVCKSKDYLRILGENNMNHMNTFWGILRTNEY